MILRCFNLAYYIAFSFTMDILVILPIISFFNVFQEREKIYIEINQSNDLIPDTHWEDTPLPKEE